MSYFDEPPGRSLEVMVGIVSSLIALMAMGLLLFFLNSGASSIVKIFSSLILSMPAVWFSRIAYRLILNRPRPDGGLLSASGVTFWSTVLGITSIAMGYLAVLEEDLYGLIASATILVGCLYGMRLAKSRCKNNV